MNDRTPRLIVTDLDGTLLDARHRLGDFTREVLRELDRRGVHIVLASGRGWFDIDAIRRRIDIDCWLITANGSRVYDPAGRCVMRRDVPSDLVAELLPLAAAAWDDLHLNLYLDQDWLVTRPNPELLKYHRDSGFEYRVVEHAELPTRGLAKLFWIGEPERLGEFEGEVRVVVGARGALTYAMPISLEVMAAGVSKGGGLEAVLDSLNVEAADTLAFGDGLNDAEMLALAGEGVLMANAHPELKSALPGLELIGSHEEEAVVRYLSQFIR